MPPRPLDFFEELAAALVPREDRSTVRVAFQGVRAVEQRIERERLRAERERAKEVAAREREVRAERRARSSTDGYDPTLTVAELWASPIPAGALPAIVRRTRTLAVGPLTGRRGAEYQK